jgi:hypothetical protein
MNHELERAWVAANLPLPYLLVFRHDATTRRYGMDRWGWRGNQYGRVKAIHDAYYRRHTEEQASQGR